MHTRRPSLAIRYVTPVVRCDGIGTPDCPPPTASFLEFCARGAASVDTVTASRLPGGPTNASAAVVGPFDSGHRD
jgi:hypothetical protein